jgi:DNA-binding CsgD family transcriptional regulator
VVKQVQRAAITLDDHIRQVQALRRESSEGRLEQVTAPTLIIASRGGTRAFANEESARWLAANILDSRLLLLDDPGGGLHAEPGEEPAAITAIAEFVAGLAPQPGAGALADGLSHRELEVLRLIAAGRSNAQIAEALVISPNTVGRHVSNIFDKIGAANRAEAAAYALRHGVA